MFRSLRSHILLTHDMLVDIVYTYVDHTDAEWCAKRKEDCETYRHDSPEGRYNTNLNELMYSIRSLEKYFKDKYNHIFIVTNTRRLPHFLAESPNITVVNDTELLGHTSYNSQAIESMLHEIPGLSEYYLYFNDDFLLNDYLDISDFVSDDILCWYEESNIIMNTVVKNPYLLYLYNTLSIFNDSVAAARAYTYDIIGYTGNAFISHSCRIFKKSLVQAFIECYKENIDELRLQPFRSTRTFCFVDAFCFWAEKNGHLVLQDTRATGILVQTDYSVDSLYNAIVIWYLNSYSFICIEDTRTNNRLNVRLQEFLYTTFDMPSKYEKSQHTIDGERQPHPDGI